jgi:hypothetical protein
LIIQRTDKFLKKYGLDTWGSNIKPPSPYTEISVSDIGSFWTMFSAYGIKEVEFRQLFLGEKYVENAHVLIYADRILIVKIKRIQKDGKFLDVPVVYRAGCIHEYEFIILNSRTGNCQNTCKHCGYSYRDYCGD